MPRQSGKAPTRHIRSTPGVDVSFCGLRENILFANTRKSSTCDVCTAKASEPRRWARARAALTAMARARSAERIILR